MILCADTKALWTILGMGPNGTYPCPLCEIHKDDMIIPKDNRDAAPFRTFNGVMHNFNENMRQVHLTVACSIF